MLFASRWRDGDIFVAIHVSGEFCIMCPKVGFVLTCSHSYGDTNISKWWLLANAQVGDDAQVSGNAWVHRNARVSGDAQVSGGAWVHGNAQVSGNAVISSSSDYFVMDNVGSESSVLTLARTVNGHTLSIGCWKDGTLDTLMSEVKKRSKHWDATEEQKAYWLEQYRTAHAQCAEIVESWNNE